ncbi:hypothetical protein MHD_10170 [Mannheimia granulomatis]|uniref:Uncharacterized protein n=1 Tax=Mannheimia granulomatis TaxID=85402 RepID=A0A011LYS0_9PAST|nr:hypothetical protein [Mannheimia granulomatis]EXI62388.1 hypothetical protein AK33_05635 [Mannheimia granulomatis]QIM66354.1 hypothetical protein A4G16_02675 [Mannheimia granulomatis]RGE47398.1 hypothetical protein MHD_10170 [Mannheimia granulomatis]
MKKLFVLVTALFSAFVVANDNKANHKLAENFCYAVQASGNCPDLNMRLDTEAKVEGIVGKKIREPNSPYADSCMKGLNKANNDKKLCENAWEKFGCTGTETAKLLQTNPFTNKTGAKCTFDK